MRADGSLVGSVSGGSARASAGCAVSRGVRSIVAVGSGVLEGSRVCVGAMVAVGMGAGDASLCSVALESAVGVVSVTATVGAGRSVAGGPVGIGVGVGGGVVGVRIRVGGGGVDSEAAQMLSKDTFGGGGAVLGPPSSQRQPSTSPGPTVDAPAPTWLYCQLPSASS